MRLIDADELRQVLEVYSEKDSLGHTPVQLCDAMPTIDAVEVVHGEWIFSRGDGKTCVDGWTCSACGNSFHTNVPYFEEFHYCPNCGAKMDGEEFEEPTINPCRGCEDYDGYGGCKSNGGCGRTEMDRERRDDEQIH